MQSLETVLFHNSNTWVTKSGNEDFDVPMRCYDNAEVWQLVGSFILNKLTSISNKFNIELHCDVDLETFQNISKSEIERKEKPIA